MEARPIYKIHSSPHGSDLLSTTEQHGPVEWSQFSSWCEPSSGSSGLAWEEQAWISAWLFLLVIDRKGTFLPFREEIFITWDGQGWGSCGAEVWRNPLQIQAFGKGFLESHQLCSTGLDALYPRRLQRKRGQIAHLHGQMICMASLSKMLSFLLCGFVGNKCWKALKFSSFHRC